MAPYIVSMALSIALACLADGSNGRRRNALIVAAFVPSIIVACLRDPSVGVDTDYYPLPYYCYSLESPLFEMMARAGCEPMFSFMIWIVSRVFGSFAMVLLVAQVIMVAPLAWILLRDKKYSAGVVLTVYMCILYPPSLNLMRQSISMSILLLAYRSAREKNLSAWFVWLVLACSFHLTGVLGLAFWPVARWSELEVSRRRKIGAELITLVAMLTILSHIFSEDLLKAATYVKRSYVVQYSELNEGSFNSLLTMFPLIISLCGLHISANLDDYEGRRLRSAAALMIMSACFATFSMESASLGRLGSVYLIIAPFAISDIVVKSKNMGALMRMTAIALILLAFAIFIWVYVHGDAAGIIPYKLTSIW